MEEVSTALDQLKDLKQQYVLVATKTNALHEACEQSMADQVSHKQMSTQDNCLEMINRFWSK